MSSTESAFTGVVAFVATEQEVFQKEQGTQIAVAVRHDEQILSQLPTGIRSGLFHPTYSGQDGGAFGV